MCLGGVCRIDRLRLHLSHRVMITLSVTERAPRTPVIGVAVGVSALVVGATLALWHHEGATIFAEMLLAGLANCF